MFKDACVLIYGKNPSLLGTRCLVLQKGGFRVVAISHMSELTHLQAGDFQVFVLCHTLTPEDQLEAIALAYTANPALHTIVMTAYAPEFHAGTMSHFVSAFDGPEELIAQVHRAVDKSHGGYAYRCHSGTGPVNLNLPDIGGQPLGGWMYTGHAKTTSQVTLSSYASKRKT
jgi:DNA-binding NtrC family response regulator